MAPLTLTKLPSELIGQICENFCIHCAKCDEKPPWKVEIWSHERTRRRLWKDRHKLYNLSLVCKKIKREAQPVLYHVYGFFDDVNTSMGLFCRSISLNAYLGERVQVLHLKVLGDVSSSWTESEIKWIGPIVEQVKSRLNLDIPTDIPKTPGFLLTILPILTILQVPQLKQLKASGRAQESVFSHIKRNSLSRRMLLPELKFLEMSTPNLGQARDRIPYIWLPLTRSVMGGFLEDFAQLEVLSLNNVRNSAVPSNLRLPRIWRLSLQYTTLNKEKLRVMVNATGQLKYFMYSEIQGLDLQGKSHLDNVNDDSPATSHDVFVALDAKTDTLRKLTVHTYHRTDEKPEPLSKLHKLESLILNIRAFCDPVGMIENGTLVDFEGVGLFEHLPPSLKSVCIHVGPHGLGYVVLCVLELCRERKNQSLRPTAKNLKQIDIALTAKELKYEENGGLDIEGGLNPGPACHEIITEVQTSCRTWLNGGRRQLRIFTEAGSVFKT